MSVRLPPYISIHIWQYIVRQNPHCYIILWHWMKNCHIKNKNIRVLSVCPGPTASNFFNKDTQEKFGSSQKFMMTSEDVAKEIIKMIEKKKRFSIIGFRNKHVYVLINLLPISLQLRLAGVILKKVIK